MHVKIFPSIFISILLVTLPLLPIRAQSTDKIWRIGMFHVGLDHVPSSVPGLREGLKTLGYEEGKNLHIDWRNLPDEAAARQVDKLFKGSSPEALPVEQPASFDLVVNLKTAKALGITIPPEVLYQATKVMR